MAGKDKEVEVAMETSRTTKRAAQTKTRKEVEKGHRNNFVMDGTAEMARVLVLGSIVARCVNPRGIHQRIARRRKSEAACRKLRRFKTGGECEGHKGRGWQSRVIFIHLWNGGRHRGRREGWRWRGTRRSRSSAIKYFGIVLRQEGFHFHSSFCGQQGSFVEGLETGSHSSRYQDQGHQCGEAERHRTPCGHRTLHDSFEVGSKGIRGWISCKFSVQYWFPFEAPCSRNMPGSVRTRSEPCGRRDNTDREQAQCDEGTVLVCRAIDMATAVAVPPVATLENRPPSDCQNIFGRLGQWRQTVRWSTIGSIHQVEKEVSKLVLQAQAQVPKDPEVKLAVVQQIQKELTKLKASPKDASENLQQAIRDLESKCESNATFLPNLVKSARRQSRNVQERQDFGVRSVSTMQGFAWLALL